MITEQWVGPLVAVDVAFVEDGDTVYSASVPIPAGATIHDIKVRSTVLWDDGTSASLTVGDESDADGYFTAVDLKATDLLVGEEINFVQTGGCEGAYLDTTTGERSAMYKASGGRVVAAIAAAGGDGSAGRSRMTVVYSSPPNAQGAIGTSP